MALAIHIWITISIHIWMGYKELYLALPINYSSTRINISYQSLNFKLYLLNTGLF